MERHFCFCVADLSYIYHLLGADWVSRSEGVWKTRRTACVTYDSDFNGAKRHFYAFFLFNVIPAALFQSLLTPGFVGTCACATLLFPLFGRMGCYIGRRQLA